MSGTTGISVSPATQSLEWARSMLYAALEDLTTTEGLLTPNPAVAKKYTTNLQNAREAINLAIAESSQAIRDRNDAVMAYTTANVVNMLPQQVRGLAKQIVSSFVDADAVFTNDGMMDADATVRANLDAASFHSGEAAIAIAGSLHGEPAEVRAALPSLAFLQLDQDVYELVSEQPMEIFTGLVDAATVFENNVAG